MEGDKGSMGTAELIFDMRKLRGEQKKKGGEVKEEMG